MATRVVTRPKSKRVDPDEIVETFRTWARFKETEENSKTQKDRLRSEALFPFIERAGEADEKGSLIVTFPKPVSITSVNADGVRKTTTYVGVKKERRPQQIFLEDKARAWAEKNGFLEQVLVTTVSRTREYNFGTGKFEVTEESVEAISQDNFYILNQEGDLPDKTLDSFFEEQVIWALVPVKA